MERAAIILAAGEGKRMQSDLPKVLHSICGCSMVKHVLNAVSSVCANKIVVVGYRGEQVKAALGDSVQYAEQKQQLGTGHAVMQAVPLLPEKGLVVIACGDTPLLEAATIEKLLADYQQSQAAAAILTAVVPDPFGYGRIVRDDKGQVRKIVEERDATDRERSIREINTGTYIFDVAALKESLANIGNNNAQGEYYLTDCIAYLIAQKKPVITSLLADYREAMGVNDRCQLAKVQAIMQSRINNKLMANGVTLVDPQTTYVDANVVVGRDTVIMPNTILRGATRIGKGCEIGPNTELIDCQVGNGVSIRHSVATGSVLEDGVKVGPFAHLRPETVLRQGAKIGDFVEIKKSQIGENTKVAHLTYIGDAQIGNGVNMGGGIIVVNYDGRQKHKTIIEDGAFVGCNTNLVAPVTIGEGAFVAAGSTITKDVPAGSLALARALQVNKEGLAKRYLGKKDEES
ncbi:MAG: bifunctional UDP-N-acetylglucosamine diphosphorylase/glucosamine-1-phosphate N-acetyltransferase GlmU [Firmicutes bacterium]|nr:bifunctional UDP-N-acetylglucosamine diphosphorylase/glucosamine-1-phosphate N-acetyltransferase GlmU [Bacillota bacterium]